MSDNLPEDAWLNLFLSTPPRLLHQALQKRLHASNAHLAYIVELFKQRAAIEAQYADSLTKLARAADQGTLVPKTGIQWDKTSGEGKLFAAVVNEISETSTSHSTLSAILRTDFEQPLRDLPSSIVAWRRIAEQDASLEKTLKDYEKTSSKLEKASSKTKSSKADNLSSELQHLTSSLSSLSPMVYNSHQRLDEERLRGLKEVIVRWGTVRADMAQKDGERAERSMAVLISWETPEEVMNVGQKLGSLGGDRLSANSAANLRTPQGTPQPERRLSAAAVNTDNDFSPRPTLRQNGSSSNQSAPPPSSFAGGIKSILGRRPTLGPNRGRSGSTATSVRSTRDNAAFAAINEDNMSQPQDPASPPVDEEGFSVAPADRHRNPWDEPDDRNEVPNIGSTVPKSTASSISPLPGNTSLSPSASANDPTGLSSPIQPSQPRINLTLATSPIRESEEDREAALQRMQQTLQMQPLQQPSRRQTIARGRRDVRNTMFGGVSDDRGSGQMGFFGDADSRIVAEPEQEGFPSRSRETSRFISSGSDTSGIHKQQESAATQQQQLSRRTSSSSVSSNNPFDFPGLVSGSSTISGGTDSALGLRASLLETLNVVMRGGQVQKVQVNGEIHLSLRLTSAVTQGPIHIRLNNFERLEKIALNPAYLAQVPDKPGEYFLNSEVLAGVTPATASRGTLLFKYQVHIPQGRESGAVPLLLEPAFRGVDGETRMILHYRSNPDSLIPIEQVSRLSLLAAFKPGPNVTNVQAKPVEGVWSPSTRRLTWSIEDTQAGGKLIAKFTNEPGEVMVPLGAQASWVAEGVLISDIGLEVIQGELETDLSFEEVKKGVQAGKYLAEPAAS